MMNRHEKDDLADERVVRETPSSEAKSSLEKNRDLKTKRKLKNPCDIHWRIHPKGYEYIMRMVHEMPGISSLSDAERRLWLRRGWELTLERLRIKQRSEGLPDRKFVHPSQQTG